MAKSVVSSLLVRVVSPGAGGPGFRLVFEGEVAGATDVGGRPSSVTAAIAARQGMSCAEARGTLGSVVQGRFRIESGLLGGVGEYDFRLSLDGVELYVGRVTVEQIGVGFAVSGRHLIDSAVLWFDDSATADAPMLACSFWCAEAEAGGGIADLGAVLYRNGRPVLGSGAGAVAGSGVGSSLAASLAGVRRRPVEVRLIDRLGTSVDAPRHRQVQLRFPGARAFVLGEVPGVHDLSAHPGVYAIRVTRGRAVVTRMVFEIDRHGVLRESGPVECRADGTRVMLLGAGRRFGPPPAEGSATIDPVYARFFAAVRPPEPVVLDVLQRAALEQVARDIAAFVEAVEPDPRPERVRVALHELLTRVEELETVVPANFAVRLGREEIPFEQLREIVLGLLSPPAFAQGDSVIGNA
ncbi:hypothetical protein [Herbiconiux ginsengi]|uniref:Uncharacterized protein n=1 Tax=Herbiconiux ginsengi TaxID=381665 RepID=A0A1H3MDN6_9MICO|nr:hypothetical protein [Herbiconiux ginsengi]SDY74842.1 hypothetical protein SAMN05216554_1383 [Herbiconiux ginsengi]